MYTALTYINVYLRNLQRQKEACYRSYVHADTLLSGTVEDLNLKRWYRYEDINILGTQYFTLTNDNLGAQ